VGALASRAGLVAAAVASPLAEEPAAAGVAAGASTDAVDSTLVEVDDSSNIQENLVLSNKKARTDA